MRCYHCMSKLNSETAFCPHCGKPPHLMNPPHHLAAGTVLFDKYLVGNAIGEGGFGITYVGLDRQLNLKVAIKEFFPSGFANRNNTVSNEVVLNYNKQGEYFSNGRENFLREAQSIAKFSNERGVVDVREFFTANNTAYIVMEFLDGVNLSKYISEHNVFPPEKIVKLMLPMMQSLERIHKEGVIHRDISPDNIVYLTNGGMKLTDFGSARYFSTDDATRSLSVVLKPGYAPHEQYGRKSNQGPWTDVYALCATLYKCITGVTPTDAFSRSQSDDLQPPSALGVKIDKELEAVIMHGLAVNPDDRFRNMGELMNAFTAAFAHPDNPRTIVYRPDEDETPGDTPLTVVAENPGEAELPPSPPPEQDSITYGDSKDYFQKLSDQKPEKPLPPLPSSEYPPENDKAIVKSEPKAKKRSRRASSAPLLRLAVLVLALGVAIGIAAQTFKRCQKEPSDKTSTTSASGDTTPDYSSEIVEATDQASTFVCSSSEFIAIGEDKTASYYSVSLYSMSGAYVKAENDKLINNSGLIAVCGNARVGYYGLREDNTVVTIKKVIESQGSRFVYVEKFGTEIASWTDVIQIVAGDDFIAGLTKSGKIVTAGTAPDIKDWSGVFQIVAKGSDMGAISKGNIARVTTTEDTWRYVAGFSCDSASFAIKKDGTVLQLQKDSSYPDTGAWGNMIALSAGKPGALTGLKRDHTVVAVGSNAHTGVSEWQDIVAVKSTPEYTVGKKSDGSFVITGDNTALCKSFEETVNGTQSTADASDPTKKTYSVRFYNYDGTLIKEDKVEEGKSATPPADPVRPSDRYYSYRFKKWVPDYSNITSDTSIYPLFDTVPN